MLESIRRFFKFIFSERKSLTIAGCPFWCCIKVENSDNESTSEETTPILPAAEEAEETPSPEDWAKFYSLEAYSHDSKPSTIIAPVLPTGPESTGAHGNTIETSFMIETFNAVSNDRSGYEYLPEVVEDFFNLDLDLQESYPNEYPRSSSPQLDPYSRDQSTLQDTSSVLENPVNRNRDSE